MTCLCMCLCCESVSLIMCHDSLPASIRGCRVKYDYTRTIIQHRSLAQILGTCALISVAALFLQFAAAASCNGIHPSPGDKPPERGRAVRNNAGTKLKMTASHSIICICTRCVYCFISLIARCMTVIALLRKATFTSSNQPSVYPVLALLFFPPSTPF